MNKFANKFAIRLLRLAIYATALVAVPTVTPARAAADSSQEMKKHKKAHKSLRIGEPKASNQAPYSTPAIIPTEK
jgi:hypothetical protein